MLRNSFAAVSVHSVHQPGPQGHAEGHQPWSVDDLCHTPACSSAPSCQLTFAQCASGRSTTRDIETQNNKLPENDGIGKSYERTLSGP